MSSRLIAIPARDPEEHHRVATTLELFFDLVSVIAIAAVTAGFHHAIAAGHGMDALPRFVFLFLAIWWAWMNFTWFASAFDSDDSAYRVLVMVIMCGELIFAGGAGHIFATLDFSFGLLGWIVMRAGMIALWLRAAAGNPGYRTTALRYAVGVALAQIAWTAMYFTTTPGSAGFFAFAAICFLIEWATPLFAEAAKATPFHRHHIIERYGLLMIISLGEVVLSISRGFGSLFDAHPTFAAVAVSISALVIVFSLWWVYFCEKEHLASTHFLTAFLWGYGHVLVYLATAAMGAAVAASIDVVTQHAEVGQSVVSRYLGVSLAAFAIALWFVRDMARGLPPAVAMALPAMAVVFLLAGLAGAPVPVFAALAVVMVVWRTYPARAHRSAAA